MLVFGDPLPNHFNHIYLIKDKIRLVVTVYWNTAQAIVIRALGGCHLHQNYHGQRLTTTNPIALSIKISDRSCRISQRRVTIKPNWEYVAFSNIKDPLRRNHVSWTRVTIFIKRDLSIHTKSWAKKRYHDSKHMWPQICFGPLGQRTLLKTDGREGNIVQNRKGSHGKLPLEFDRDKLEIIVI